MQSNDSTSWYASRLTDNVLSAWNHDAIRQDRLLLSCINSYSEQNQTDNKEMNIFSC